MGGQRRTSGLLPPHARSDLASAIEAAAGESAQGQSPSEPVEPVTHLETALADVSGAATTDIPQGVVERVAPGGDVEPWAVLESPATEVQMELVVSNPAAESSALEGVRGALEEMQRDGVAYAADGDDSPAPVSMSPASAEERLRAALLAGREAVADDDFGPPDLPEAEPTDQLDSRTRTPEAASTSRPEPSSSESSPEADHPSHQTIPAAEDPADDFGPLTADVPLKGPRSSRKRVLLGVSGILAGALVVGAAFSLVPGDREAGAQTAGTAAQAGSAPQPSSTDVTWRTWRGMQVPVSAHDGPAVWASDGDRVSGFEKTPRGAALAAANLSVRVDPAAGESVWRPVLASQVVGDSARLKAALEAASSDLPRQGAEPGDITGWRVQATGKEDVVVHLAVGTGDGAEDFAVSLAWHNGDWALDIPGPSEPIFSVGETNGDYAPFQGGT